MNGFLLYIFLCILYSVLLFYIHKDIYFLCSFLWINLFLKQAALRIEMTSHFQRLLAIKKLLSYFINVSFCYFFILLTRVSREDFFVYVYNISFDIRISIIFVNEAILYGYFFNSYIIFNNYKIYIADHFLFCLCFMLF